MKNILVDKQNQLLEKQKQKQILCENKNENVFGNKFDNKFKYKYKNYNNNKNQLKIEMDHKSVGTYVNCMSNIATLYLVDFDKKYYFQSPQNSIILEINYDLFNNSNSILTNSNNDNWFAIIENLDNNQNPLNIYTKPGFDLKYLLAYS